MLDDVFWTVIPFGTGGRRGKMYPIGTNAINDRTIGESAQGLAEYVREVKPEGRPLSCAIAYDTRHRSVEFSKLCAEVMVAAGFRRVFVVFVVLRVGRAAELAAPDHERVVQHAAGLQVLDEGVAGAVDVATLQRQIAGQVAVVVPAAVEDLHEADVAFDHAPGQQAAGREGPGLLPRRAGNGRGPL